MSMWLTYVVHAPPGSTQCPAPLTISLLSTHVQSQLPATLGWSCSMAAMEHRPRQTTPFFPETSTGGNLRLYYRIFSAEPQKGACMHPRHSRKAQPLKELLAFSTE